eukprot:gene3227-6381_t
MEVSEPPCLCLPCNVLFWSCRRAVSQNKKRYQKEGFDLDLTHLSEQIIVHGYPATGIEHVYRNPRYEVQRFLETYHKNHYCVFNFCIEPGRNYDAKVFGGRVHRFPFKDHCCPSLESMVTFANTAKLWLEQNENNICSLHCKAGKGRAGLMSCVLLLRIGVCQTATEAIERYDTMRTVDRKGLTLVSQRKYVHFYEKLWRLYWNISSDIGQIPAVAQQQQSQQQQQQSQQSIIDPSPKFFTIPTQPDLFLESIQLLNIQTGIDSTIKPLKVKIYVQSHSPVLLWDCGLSPTSSPTSSTSTTTTVPFRWICNCTLTPNFIIRFEERSSLRYMKIFELWHNTLFMKFITSYEDFSWDDINSKPHIRRRFGDSLIVRLNFIKTQRSCDSFRSNSYAMNCNIEMRPLIPDKK